MSVIARVRTGLATGASGLRRPWFAALAVTILFFGTRLGLIAVAGFDLPVSDQWDAEAANLYLPYLQDELTFAHWVAPHNEHRILFTRLLALGLLQLNGQWDPKLQLVVNAFLAAATLGLLVALLVASFSGWQRALAVVGLAALWVVPAGWENTLFAFQAQFFFLLLFTFLHLGGTTLAPPGSRARSLAQLAGGAALFSMASGIASPAAVLGLLILRLLRERRIARSDRSLWWWNLGWVVLGLFLQTRHAGHETLRATSVTEFFHGLLWLLSWPTREKGWAFLLLLPFLGLLVNTWRAPSPLRHFLLALAGWWIVQVLLLAYARGSGPLGSSRYLDLLMVGLAVAGVSWLDGGRSVRRGVAIGALVLLASAWAIVVGRGLLHVLRDVQEGVVPVMRADFARWLPRFRQEVTRPGTGFVDADPYVDIPYPNAERLAWLLRQPPLRRILPPSLRPPLDLAAERSVSHGLDRVPLPAGTPPEVAVTWGRPTDDLALPATFASRELRTRWPRVLIHARGQGILRVETPGARPQTLALPSPNRWVEWMPATQGGPFRLSAQVPAGQELVFSAPVELRRGSWLARALLPAAPVVVYAGLSLLALSLLALVAPATRARPPIPPASP